MAMKNLSLESAQLSQRRCSDESRGKSDFRTPFQRDHARLIHCSAFRRLQGKTQVLGLGDSDFYRTRLTHSIEVSQIAAGIVGHLHNSKSNAAKDLLSHDICLAAGLAHDIGHPPFGHAGETELQDIMSGYGGFEGNAQTLRIITNLEEYKLGFGLNPTRRLVLALLKYPVSYSSASKESVENNHKGASAQVVRKCYYDSEQEWIDWAFAPFSAADKTLFTATKFDEKNEVFKSQYCSFDTSILNLADDISYGVHDLEDGIVLRLVTRADFDKLIESKSGVAGKAAFNQFLDQLSIEKREEFLDELFDSEYTHRRKSAIGALVHYFISSAKVEPLKKFEHRYLDLQVGIGEQERNLLKFLMDLVNKKMIQRKDVKMNEYRGKQIIRKVFNVFIDQTSFLSRPYQEKISNDTPVRDRFRIICDFVAGMTDEYILRIYEKLFGSHRGNRFEFK